MIFCKHDYELVNQFQMKSAIERFLEKYSGLTASMLHYTIGNNPSLIIEKAVTDYKCKKCNKIKRLIVKN